MMLYDQLRSLNENNPLCIGLIGVGKFGDREMGQSLSEWCNMMYLNNNDYQ